MERKKVQHQNFKRNSGAFQGGSNIDVSKSAFMRKLEEDSGYSDPGSSVDSYGSEQMSNGSGASHSNGYGSGQGGYGTSAFGGDSGHSSGFTKKVDASGGGTNYGWRGVEGGFQKRVESSGSKGSRGSAGQGGYNRPYPNNSELGSNYGAPKTISAEEYIPDQSQSSGLGGIRINNTNADKININGAYNGKINVNGPQGSTAPIGSSPIAASPLNVRGTSETPLTPSGVSGHNALSNSERIRIADSTFGSPQTSGISISSGSIKESRISFDDHVGLRSSSVTQKNLASAGAKLNTLKIDITKLTGQDAKTLAQSGIIHGRRVPLTSGEQESLRAFITANSEPTANPRSFSTLYNSGTLGGFRSKGSQIVSNYRAAGGPSQLGRISIGDTPYSSAKMGNIRLEGSATSALRSGSIAANRGAGLGALIGKKNEIGVNADPIESKIKVISSFEERTGGELSGGQLGKIKITSGHNVAGLNATSNMTLSDSSIVRNFKINNQVGTGRLSKIMVNSSGLGLLKGSKKAGAAGVGAQKSMFNIPGLSHLAKQLPGIQDFGSSLVGQMSKLPALFSGTAGVSTKALAAILSGSILGTTMFSAVTTSSLLTPFNNFYRDEDNKTMYGGADVLDGNTTLQKIIDELEFKQRAYEYNLVFCDEETEGIYGLGPYATEKRKYIEEGIPDSWKGQLQEGSDNWKFMAKCGLDKEDINKTFVTTVYHNFQIAGYRLGGHLWGPSIEDGEWNNSTKGAVTESGHYKKGKTCTYPEPDGPDDAYNGSRIVESLAEDRAGRGDNRIRIWEKSEWRDENGVWHDEYVDSYKYMYLYCIGGLEGDAGKYSGGEGWNEVPKRLSAHVNHDSPAVENQRLKDYQKDFEEFKTNEGGKLNNGINVVYKYEGSRYSYLFTEEKYPSFKTIERKTIIDSATGEKASVPKEITYDTYEFYKAIIAAAESFCHDGEENYEYLEEYVERIFDAAMDNATIEIVPEGDGAGNLFVRDDSTRLHWDYSDPVGAKAMKEGHDEVKGKNEEDMEGCISHCSSPTYNFPVRVEITIHDSGYQDLIMLDQKITEESEEGFDGMAHKKFFERVVEKIKELIGKIRGLLRGEKGSLGRFFIDEEYIAEHPEAKPFYNEWRGWKIDGGEDNTEEDFIVTPGFTADKVERTTSQMSYGIAIVDMDKQSFDEFYEGIYLPTSSVLWDIVPDEEDSAIDAGEMAEGEILDGAGVVGQSPRPTVRDGGVMLDNLRYINQGTVSFAEETRYIRDDGSVSKFRNSGCLDSSIMMIYYHYYASNAANVDDATIHNLWRNKFRPTIPNGSGALGTSTVISQLGLTASGAHYVSKEGWDQAIDSLYMGNPVLLHIAGKCDTGLVHTSPGGHFLIIVGCDDQYVYVYDPGKKANTGKAISWDDPCWSYYMSNGSLYYKLYNATGATGQRMITSTNGSTTIAGLSGNVMNIPGIGDYINVTEINGIPGSNSYTLQRYGHDAYSMEGTILDAQKKWPTIYNRIQNIINSSGGTNAGSNGQLLTVQKNGQTYYVAALVDGFSAPGGTYKVNLNNGQSFNVVSVDVKSLNDARGTGSAGQIDSSYGHGTIIGDKVQMNIVEFFDASTSSTSEYSSSAAKYSYSPVQYGTYVTSVEATGVF